MNGYVSIKIKEEKTEFYEKYWMHKMKIPLYFRDDFKSGKIWTFPLFFFGRSRSNTLNVQCTWIGYVERKKKYKNDISLKSQMAADIILYDFP